MTTIIMMTRMELMRNYDHLTQSARGATSEPCCMKAPNVNQNAFKNVYWFSYLASKMRLVIR